MPGVSEYSDPGARRDHSVWDFLNRLLFVVAAFVVIALMVTAFLPKLKKQREQDAQLEQLKSEIEKGRMLLAHRTREVDLLQHDPGYVEIIARDRLEMMKEGETIYRVDAQPTPDLSRMKRQGN